MKLTVQNAAKYERVYLPVWSAENGQDDLVWYAAQRTKGNRGVFRLFRAVLNGKQWCDLRQDRHA